MTRLLLAPLLVLMTLPAMAQRDGRGWGDRGGDGGRSRGSDDRGFGRGDSGERSGGFDPSRFGRGGFDPGRSGSGGFDPGRSGSGGFGRGGEDGGRSFGGGEGGGRSFSRGPDRDGRGAPSGPAAAAAATPAAPKPYKPTPRPRVTVDLPESFRGRDGDADGQISLSEWRTWDRGRIEEFHAWDSNGDGFVTPREFAAGMPTLPAAGPVSLTAASGPDAVTAAASESAKR